MEKLYMVAVKHEVKLKGQFLSSRSNYPIFGQWKPHPLGSCVLLIKPQYSCIASLLSGQDILGPSCTFLAQHLELPWNCGSFKGEMVFRDYNLDAKGVCCYLFVIVFRHFQWRALGNMYCFRKRKINHDFILYSQV